MSSATKHNVLRLLQPMTTGHSRESWIENIEEGNHTVWKCQPPLPHFLCRCWHLERKTRRQIPHITTIPRRREMWLHGSFEMSTEPCWNFSWRYNVNNAWFSSYNSLHCVGLFVFPVLHDMLFVPATTEYHVCQEFDTFYVYFDHCWCIVMQTVHIARADSFV